MSKATILKKSLEIFNPNIFTGVVGKVRKKNLPKEEGIDGGEKKGACSGPAGAGAQTWVLLRARWESPATCHWSFLDK